MKNKFLLSAIIVVFSVLPVISFAQTNTGTEKRETIKDTLEAKKEALKQEMASRTDAIKTSVQERRQTVLNKISEKVDQFLQNAAQRYDAAVNRLAKLADRIDSRITKLEAAKIDVSKTKELMAAARAKINTAEASVASLITTTNSTEPDSTTPALKVQFQGMKTQMEKTKNDIRAAHTALVDVVNSLKPGNNKLMDQERLREHATSTANTTKTEN